ncbi:MAG: hypothetical protein JXX14_20620 [Deltaproteobacteria bacterium]|nr:hypothetical protein [Deltaproteobacteria bacterium]
MGNSSVIGGRPLSVVDCVYWLMALHLRSSMIDVNTVERFREAVNVPVGNLSELQASEKSNFASN